MRFIALCILFFGTTAAADDALLPWYVDDYKGALADAQASERPIVIDLWAPWCHTCLSMKNTVLADPALATVAERFELYIAGVELCNGFTELNDPLEQRARFEEDLDRRRAMGLSPYPLPERFLAALEQGMPPSGGVALGLDRLLMLALDKKDIGEVLIR